MTNAEEPIEIIDLRKGPNQIIDKLLEYGVDTVEKLEALIGPNFYAVIPLSILESKLLSANAKLLFAEIVALSKKNGYCFATNRYLAERIGVSERSIRNQLRELKGEMLISVSFDPDKVGTYRYIYVIGDWGGRKNLPGGVETIGQGGRKQVATQKRYKQRDINKENVVATTSVAEPRINDFIDMFRNVNPSFKRLFANTTQRAAMERLLKEHGREKITWVMDVLPKISGMKYAPTITKPTQLEDKLGDLVAFVRKEQGKAPIVAKIR